MVLKIVHLHMPNQKKHHCDSQKSRYILQIGLFWLSNSGILHKWNTWSKQLSHIPCTHWSDCLLFLLNWDACLSVRDSRTDVNWHLSDTWLLCFFLQIRKNWTSSTECLYIVFLVDSFLISLANWFWCEAGIKVASPAYLRCVGLYLIIWLEIRSQNVQKSIMFLYFCV